MTTSKELFECWAWAVSFSWAGCAAATPCQEGHRLASSNSTTQSSSALFPSVQSWMPGFDWCLFGKGGGPGACTVNARIGPWKCFPRLNEGLYRPEFLRRWSLGSCSSKETSVSFGCCSTVSRSGAGCWISHPSWPRWIHLLLSIYWMVDSKDSHF